MNKKFINKIIKKELKNLSLSKEDENDKLFIKKDYKEKKIKYKNNINLILKEKKKI